jgi:hypothetical protein|tara:strand:- start:132 stop:344 length:213 start_codon:yes stop_codon:yes gene_type:complete
MNGFKKIIIFLSRLNIDSAAHEHPVTHSYQKFNIRGKRKGNPNNNAMLAMMFLILLKGTRPEKHCKPNYH